MYCFVSEFVAGLIIADPVSRSLDIYSRYVSWYVILLACLYYGANLDGLLQRVTNQYHENHGPRRTWQKKLQNWDPPSQDLEEQDVVM